jgi:hypothetical protein
MTDDDADIQLALDWISTGGIMPRLPVVDPEMKGGRKETDILVHMLTIRNQIKIYHWQTKKFSRHKATDDLTAALDTKIDEFIESYMGRYGSVMIEDSIKLHNFNETDATKFIKEEIAYLQDDLPKAIKKKDTDLLGIRDEILAELTKVSYLFTLT